MMVLPEGAENYQNFDNTRVKLFPNFTRKPFDYVDYNIKAYRMPVGSNTFVFLFFYLLFIYYLL